MVAMASSLEREGNNRHDWQQFRHVLGVYTGTRVDALTTLGEDDDGVELFGASRVTLTVTQGQSTGCVSTGQYRPQLEPRHHNPAAERPVLERANDFRPIGEGDGQQRRSHR